MKNVVILGSGRSGTSLIAGLFANSGYFMGDNLYGARESNPKGFFEDPEINSINEEIIVSKPSDSHFDDVLEQGQGWLARIAPGASFTGTMEILQRIQALVKRQPFCFKDPRFSYAIPVWRPYLTDTVFICVFRDPATTVQSIMKECRLMPYLQDLEMDHRRALDTWVLMYRNILDSLRCEGEWLFIHYNQCFDPATLDRIEMLTGARIDRSFPEKSLKRSKPDFLVPPEAEETYRQLCQLAGFGYDEKEILRSIIAEKDCSIAALETTVRQKDKELAGLLPDMDEEDSLSQADTEKPSTSIVLFFDADLDLTWSAVEALVDNTPSGNYEIVCVSSKRPKHFERRLRKVLGANIIIVEAPSESLVRAYNAGLERTSGEFIVLLNPAVQVEPGWLDSLLDVVPDQGLCAVSPKVIGRDNSLLEAGCSTIENGLMRGRGFGEDPFTPRYGCVADLEAGSRFCLLVSRETLNRVGGLNGSRSDIGLAFREFALNVRSQGGRLIYQPRSVMSVSSNWCVDDWGFFPALDLDESIASKRPVISPKAADGIKPEEKPPRILVLGWYRSDAVSLIEDTVRVLYRPDGRESQWLPANHGHGWLRESAQAIQVDQRWIACGEAPPKESLSPVTHAWVQDRKEAWGKLKELLAANHVSKYDYLLLINDEVLLPRGFAATFFGLQRKLDFLAAQPALTAQTLRGPSISIQHTGTIARETSGYRFGPVVSVHSSLFDIVLHMFNADNADLNWYTPCVPLLGESIRSGIIDAVPVAHILHRLPYSSITATHGKGGKVLPLDGWYGSDNRGFVTATICSKGIVSNG